MGKWRPMARTYPRSPSTLRTMTCYTNYGDNGADLHGSPAFLWRGARGIFLVWPECGPQNQEAFQKRHSYHSRKGEIASAHLFSQVNSCPQGTMGSFTIYWQTDASQGKRKTCLYSLTLLVGSFKRDSSELGLETLGSSPEFASDVLCDLRQAASPLWASVFSSEKWDNSI